MKKHILSCTICKNMKEEVQTDKYCILFAKIFRNLKRNMEKLSKMKRICEKITYPFMFFKNTVLLSTK